MLADRVHNGFMWVAVTGCSAGNTPYFRFQLGRHHLWECGTPLEGVPHSRGFCTPTQWHTKLPVPLKINSGTCRDLSYICTFPRSRDTYGPPAHNYVMMAGKLLMSLI